MSNVTADWSVLVYMNADDDLEPYLIEDFNEMELCGSTGRVNVVVQMDRHPGYDASMSPEQAAQMREKMIDRLAGKLDLNADQKQRLGVLGDKLHAQRVALMGQGGDPRAEMRALVAGDKFDAARAQALINEKTTAVQAGSPEVIAALADFYNSLNPAQQQKVRDFMDRRHSRWSQRG